MLNVLKLRQTLHRLPSSDKLKGKCYLFVTVRSYSFVLHQELFLANILARNGAKVVVLLDDGNLPHWDTYQLHESVTPRNASLTLRNRLTRVLFLTLYHHPSVKIEQLADSNT